MNDGVPRVIAGVFLKGANILGPFSFTRMLYQQPSIPPLPS